MVRGSLFSRTKRYKVWIFNSGRPLYRTTNFLLRIIISGKLILSFYFYSVTSIISMCLLRFSILFVFLLRCRMKIEISIIFFRTEKGNFGGGMKCIEFLSPLHCLILMVGKGNFYFHVLIFLVVRSYLWTFSMSL